MCSAALLNYCETQWHRSNQRNWSLCMCYWCCAAVLMCTPEFLVCLIFFFPFPTVIWETGYQHLTGIFPTEVESLATGRQKNQASCLMAHEWCLQNKACNASKKTGKLMFPIYSPWSTCACLCIVTPLSINPSAKLTVFLVLMTGNIKLYTFSSLISRPFNSHQWTVNA